MLRPLFITGSVLSLAMLASLGSAQITQQGNRYLFRLKLDANRSINYQATSNVNMQGQGADGLKVTMPIRMRITSVRSGVATIESTIGPANMNGNTQGEAQKITSRINSQGNVIGASKGESSVTFIPLPRDPIAVGATWESTMPLPSLGAGLPATNTNTRFRFVGVRTVGGTRVAEISSFTTANMQQMGTLRMNNTFFLSMADGFLHSGNSSGSMNVSIPTGGAGSKPTQQTVRMTMNIRRG
ncbi:MAG: hypothetical protein ACK4P3_06540 [Fimbriimonadaceae bacterium]